MPMGTDRDGSGESLRRRFRYRLSTLMVAIAVLAVWLGALVVPGVGDLFLGGAAVIAATLLILLLAMGLGWVGFGLFALADRALSWARRGPEWFQAGEEE